MGVISIDLFATPCNLYSQAPNKEEIASEEAAKSGRLIFPPKHFTGHDAVLTNGGLPLIGLPFL